MDPLLDFTGKVAVITGAAQGFGQLLAEELAKRGAKLVISDINEAGVHKVADGIAATGAEVFAMQCDVSKNEQCKAMVDKAIEAFGRVDIGVNNAGIAHEFMPLHDIDESIMDRQFAINVKGVQFGMRHQIQQMLTQGEGIILNDTASNHVRYVGRDGVNKAFKIVTYAEEDIEFAGIDDSKVARQGFGRGLCAVGDRFLAGGSSPSTVTLYDLRSGEAVASVNLTMDIRNAIHGLEVWA